jgi:REP element-mobilizing transposase RayT
MNFQPKTLSFTRGRLPHWEVERGRYFVTLYLKNAIPAHAAARIRRYSIECNRLPPGSEKARLKRYIFRLMEEWLDRCEGEGLLAHPEIASMLMEALEFRMTHRQWAIPAYVIMPTHLHLFVGRPDGRIINEVSLFKRWTSRKAGEMIDLSGRSFWHSECFDHWSRSAEAEEKYIRYIQQNPVKAGLVRNYLDWPYGSWSRDK